MFHNLFVFVPEFLDFIFDPWTPMSRKEWGNSSKNKDDKAKEGSNFEGSTNK